MYRVTEEGTNKEKYNSSTPLPDNLIVGEFNLWQEDVRIGRLTLDNANVNVTLDDDEVPVHFQRDVFEELFHRDAHLVELLYRSDDLKRVELRFKKQKRQPKSHGKFHAIRLFKETSVGPEFYGDLYYWFQ